jgi:hypothetical protein
VFHVRKAIFICIFLSFVISLVFFPLYMKIVHFAFQSCGSVLFCLCWLAYFVSRFVLHLLLCSVFLCLPPFSLPLLLLGMCVVVDI